MNWPYRSTCMLLLGLGHQEAAGERADGRGILVVSGVPAAHQRRGRCDQASDDRGHEGRCRPLRNGAEMGWGRTSCRSAPTGCGPGARPAREAQADAELGCTRTAGVSDQRPLGPRLSTSWALLTHVSTLTGVPAAVVEPRREDARARHRPVVPADGDVAPAARPASVSSTAGERGWSVMLDGMSAPLLSGSSVGLEAGMRVALRFQPFRR